MTENQPHFVRCWVDGGVVGHNPGPRGIYWSARVEMAQGHRPVTVRKRIPAVVYKTNNDAEWMALREALLWLVERNVRQPVVIYSDSRLIVNQFNEKWACQVERHQKLRAECKELASKLKWLGVMWRSRDIMVRKLGH